MDEVMNPQRIQSMQGMKISFDESWNPDRYLKCHPGGIYALVDTAVPSNCKDPYRITYLIPVHFVV